MAFSPQRSPAGSSATHVRYLVLAVLCLAAVVAYIHRGCLGVPKLSIGEDLGLSDEQMDWVLTAFFLGYALFQIPGGYLGDRLGTRKGLALFIIIWSTATGMLGFADGYFALFTLQVINGMAQAGIFPSCVKSFSHWFPQLERAFPSGMLGSFMSVGGALATFLTGLLLSRLPWQTTIAVLGFPGIAFGIFFYWWFRDRPDQHSWVNSTELQYIEEGLEDVGQARPATATRHYEDATYQDDQTVREPGLPPAGSASVGSMPADSDEPTERFRPGEPGTTPPSVASAGEASRSGASRMKPAGFEPSDFDDDQTYVESSESSESLAAGESPVRPAAPREVAVPHDAASRDTERSHHAAPVPWARVFTNVPLLMICGQQFFRAAAYVFYPTQFPTYLQETRAATESQSGYLTSLPLLGVVFGSMTGGIVMDWILRRTGSRGLSRKGIGLFGVISSGLCLLGGHFAEGAVAAIAWIIGSTFFAGLTGPAAYTATIDISGRHVATVFSIMNTAGNVGAVLMPISVGWFVRATSWDNALLFVAVLYVGAALCWLFVNVHGKISPADGLPNA